MAADPLSRVFSALADPTRRDIVARLAVGDATVDELAEPYDVSVQAVSKHLKVLEDAGLVSRTRRRPAPSGAPRSGGVRPHDQVDRALPPRRPRSATAASTTCSAAMPDETRTPTPDHRTPDRSSTMTTTSTHETEIERRPRGAARADHPRVRRPGAKVFRAHADPELFTQWIGPRDHRMRIEHYDCRTGGVVPLRALRDGEESPASTARFHEVRPDELIVQTFTFEGVPDGVALERSRFEDLGDGRSRLTATSLVDSFEARDAFVASGMETGVGEGYEQLDELLAA